MFWRDTMPLRMVAQEANRLCFISLQYRRPVLLANVVLRVRCSDLIVDGMYSECYGTSKHMITGRQAGADINHPAEAIH